jgi:hypothetical protein
MAPIGSGGPNRLSRPYNRALILGRPDMPHAHETHTKESR